MSLFVFSVIDLFFSFYYEWVKRLKFLLAVIYGSPCRNSDSSKTFKKDRKKLKYSFMTIFGPAESFKIMNRPGPTRPDRNALWRLITQKVWKIETWNFNTIFIQHSNLCYQNLILISLIVWKQWSFPQGSHFVNFQQFFHHNFRLRRDFWI